MFLIIHNLRITPHFSTSQETENNSFILALVHSSSQQTGHMPMVREELPTTSLQLPPERDSFLKNSFSIP